MKERPILFSASMVRALLAGTKTQTRRTVKTGREFKEWDKTPDDAYNVLVSADGFASFLVSGDHGYTDPAACPYGAPGDRLWVKESHALVWPGDGPPADIRDNHVEYRADTDGVSRPGEWPDDCDDQSRPRWRPSIHMHRWAARITLEVTGVRVERVQDITESDAKAEGVARDTAPCDHTRLSCEEIGCMGTTYRSRFAELWIAINGAKSWDANSWVWVVEFERTGRVGRSLHLNRIEKEESAC